MRVKALAVSFMLLFFCLSCGKAEKKEADLPVSTPAEVIAETKGQAVVEIAVQTPAAPTERPEFLATATAEQSTAIPETTPAPLETDTPEPRQTVVPVSDEQLDAGHLDAWFSDSVLVGDSLVAGLSGYVTQERSGGGTCLGNMQLVSASALTLKKAAECEQNIRPAELKLRTRYMTISEVVETLQAKRVFIMLGVSDLRWFTADELIDTYDKLINAVKKNHPDVEIYIHSIMPMLKDYAKQVGVSYEMNKAANEALRAFCEKKGYTYIELADLVRDEDGYLVYEYSASDYRFHLNKEGKKIWVRCLRSCARDELYAGKWSLEGK